MVKLLNKLMMINNKELYDQARQLPNVNYIGYKPNEYIKENLHQYDIFAYLIYGKKLFVYLQ
jgi:hypothetical protein